MHSNRRKMSQACNGPIKKRKTQKSDLNEIIHFTLPLTFRYFQVYIEILHKISSTKNNITVITVIINHSRLASKNYINSSIIENCLHWYFTDTDIAYPLSYAETQCRILLMLQIICTSFHFSSTFYAISFYKWRIYN